MFNYPEFLRTAFNSPGGLKISMTEEICANCGAPCVEVKVCSACKCTPYCGRECQRGHWQQVGA